MPAALIASLLLLAMGAVAAPRGKWVEARSPNFIVVSDAGESQARKLAVQFEQIRSLFRDSLSYVKGVSSPIVVILAVKDEDSLRELLPEFWAQKGRAHPSGIFVSRSNEFQIAVNLAAHGDNPFEAIYHEYYHSVTMPYFPNLPTWLSEGLADFYGNSVITDKTARLGIPNVNLIAELRRSTLIPLSVLFKVDHSSPYYHEQNEVSIFYAESWALTHYLMLGDNQAHRALLGAYLNALSHGASQDEAAKVFGDIGKLQNDLSDYMNRATLPVIEAPVAARVSDSELSVHALSDAEIDAYYGGFLTLHDQFQKAEPLLKEATRLNPKLALAQGNLALLHYYRHEYTEALASLSAAIALDFEDATLRYLRADLTFENVSHTDSQIEEDLRHALALRPDYAAANALLAVYLAAKNEKLAEALTMGQKAVLLEPGNATFELVLAQVLLRTQRYDEAETWARRARTNANDDRVRAETDKILSAVAQARNNEIQIRERQDAAVPSGATAPVMQSGEASAQRFPSTESEGGGVPEVEHRAPGTGVDGIVTQVRCNGNAMEITVKVEAGPPELLFRAKDRYRIDYTSDVPTVGGDIEPCAELKGHTARIVFSAAGSKEFQGELTRIEVTK